MLRKFRDDRIDWGSLGVTNIPVSHSSHAIHGVSFLILRNATGIPVIRHPRMLLSGELLNGLSQLIEIDNLL